MSATLPQLPETALAEIANRVTRERELSETGAAYYGSNWEEVRKLYTEAQMRAYGEQCAAAARLAEREECAKVCEQWGAWNNTAHDIAAAIRARSET